MTVLYPPGEFGMRYPEDTDIKEDNNEKRRPILDGTASLDYADDEPVPRVKGLIELLNQYFGSRRNGSKRG